MTVEQEIADVARRLERRDKQMLLRFGKLLLARPGESFGIPDKKNLNDFFPVSAEEREEIEAKLSPSCELVNEDDRA